MASPKISDAATYKVALAKTIRIGRTTISPNENPKLRGDALKAIIATDASAVTSYEAI